MVIASDLAKLYQCTNVAKDIINQAVKRNLLRFSDDFYFQLTKEGFFLLAVPIWDFKLESIWWSEKIVICFHRARCGYAGDSS